MRASVVQDNAWTGRTRAWGRARVGGWLLAIPMLALLLGGCSDMQPTAPSAQAVAPRADAASSTVSYDVPFKRVRFVSCANGGAGEWVAVSGTMHNVLSFTTSATGIDHLLYHHQLENVSGTGQSTGDAYQYVGGANESAVLGLGTAINVGETFTVAEQFTLVEQGAGPTFQLQQLFHVTVNPDGTLTSYVEDGSVTCP
ncbi:MAG TPA: hypothetical protein VF832_19300 [Longimicrobiales bacterium]